MRGAILLEGFEERVLEARACGLRYFVGGAGTPVVLIHGLGGAASNWSELAPLLAARHRVLVPDLPGHGGSSALPATASVDAFADRVRSVAHAEGMLPAAFVGHSMGGLVAIRLALRHSADVTALVLAASAGIESSTRRARFWLGLATRLRPTRWLGTGRRVLVRSLGARRLVFVPIEAADAASLSPRAIEGLLGPARLHTGLRDAVAALVADDPRVELDGVRAPAFVLWGARDRQLPIGDGFELARRLRAPFRAIADCGHLLIAERPESCAAAIEEFLARRGSEPR